MSHCVAGMPYKQFTRQPPAEQMICGNTKRFRRQFMLAMRLDEGTGAMRVRNNFLAVAHKCGLAFTLRIDLSGSRRFKLFRF